MTRVLPCLVATLLVLSACASAPPPSPAAATQSAPDSVLPAERVLSVVPGAPVHVRSDSVGELVLRLHIESGYHVMSNQPSQPQYIPTRVELDPVADVSWQPARFPAAQAFHFADQEITTFVGELSVAVPFQVASGAVPGARELSGYVGYQACTEGSCLFPTRKPFAAQLIVE